MKIELEIIKTNIKDLIIELVYKEEEIEVWVTRENFGLKTFMWGFLHIYMMSIEDIIEVSMLNLKINFEYWKEELEL